MKKVLISLEELIQFMEWAYSDCASPRNLLDEIIPWFNAQPPAPQWVRVEDGLPGYGERVLVKYVKEWWRKDNSVMVDIAILKAPNEDYGIRTKAAWRVDFEYGASGSSACRFIDDVTHWMPIPPLPEVKDGA